MMLRVALPEDSGATWVPEVKGSQFKVTLMLARW